MRLRRNCTKHEHFPAQVEKIGQRFTNKGYKQDLIKQKIEEVKRMDRATLIKDKEKDDTRTNAVPIVLNYNTQHKNVEDYKTPLAHVTDRHTFKRTPPADTNICI